MWVIKSSLQATSGLHRFFRGIVAALLFLSLNACVRMNDPDVSQDFNHHIIGILDQNQTIEQSFISRRPRLNGISLWVTFVHDLDSNPPTGQLLFKLYSSNRDTQLLFATSIPISSSWDNSQIDITFPPQDDQPGQPYYIQIESSGSAIQVLGRNEDTYPDGTAFIHGEETVADISFHTTYDYGLNAVLQDLSTWALKPGLILLLGLSLFLPGWTLLDLFGLRKFYSHNEQAALSVGLSLAVIPLLMFWSTVLQIRWSNTGVFWIFGFLTGYWILRFVISNLISKNNHYMQLESTVNLHEKNDSSHFSKGLILCGIIAGVFFVRLAMVRDLATPAWVDSVHHALITQMIIKNGGFPSSYAPYMEFDIHNYHVGFHSNLAVFTWLSGLGIHDSMLIYGQALNALASLSVYLLTTTLTRKPQAGLFAAFITGFLTPMPAYYTSWGRYTQLAGLLILPSILSFLILGLRQDKSANQHFHVKRNSILLAIIAISGLFLVHYRVLAFLILLLFAKFISDLTFQGSSPRKAILSKWLISTFVILIGSVALVFPWFFHAISQIFIPKLTPPAFNPVTLFNDFSWRFLTTALGKQALLLASIGVVTTSTTNMPLIMTMLLWIIQLLFFANMDALKLPGGGFITGTSVVIMLFLPISVVGGSFLDQITSAWQITLRVQTNPFIRKVFWGVIIVISVFVATLGARQILPLLNPITILSRQADLDAIDWIQHNIPTDSTFILNSFSWGFGLYAGSDGGYWISPITGANSLPPPALYGLGKPEIVNHINTICQIVVNTDTSPQELWNLMDENKVEYIFIGRRGGPLSYSALLRSNLFDQVYNTNGVWILKPR